jgi:hypothetical protein
MKRRKNSKAGPITAADPATSNSILSSDATLEFVKAWLLKDAQEMVLRPQDMAESFREDAKCITKARLRFLSRPDDPELVMEYEKWRYLTHAFHRRTRKHVENCPALPEVPKLIGNDYYAAMIHLEDFCAEVAERLCPAGVKALAKLDPRTATRLRKLDVAAPFIHDHGPVKKEEIAEHIREKTGLRCKALSVPELLKPLRAQGLASSTGPGGGYYFKK